MPDRLGHGAHLPPGWGAPILRGRLPSLADMSIRLITILGLAGLGLGLGLVVHGSVRIGALDAESAQLAETSRAAGASYVETLRGEHATRQMQALDRRREVAVARAAARRNRLLGLLLGVAGGLGLATAAAFRRMAGELQEAGHGPPGPPGEAARRDD